MMRPLGVEEANRMSEPGAVLLAARRAEWALEHLLTLVRPQLAVAHADRIALVLELTRAIARARSGDLAALVPYLRGD